MLFEVLSAVSFCYLIKRQLVHHHMAAMSAVQACSSGARAIVHSTCEMGPRTYDAALMLTKAIFMLCDARALCIEIARHTTLERFTFANLAGTKNVHIPLDIIKVRWKEPTKASCESKTQFA